MLQNLLESFGNSRIVFSEKISTSMGWIFSTFEKLGVKNPFGCKSCRQVGFFTHGVMGRLEVGL